MSPSPANTPKRVFISYKRETSGDHNQRVYDLADTLRGHGIDAWIDEYDLHHSYTWEEWMEGQIRNADFVLVICSQAYFEYVERRVSAGGGQGVLHEMKIMRNALYDSPGVNPKFLPVLLPTCVNSHIPTPLRGFTYYQMERYELIDAGYERLLRRITEQKIQPRELGSVPNLSSPHTAPVNTTVPPLGSVPNLPPAPSKPTTDPKDGAELIYIPAGKFLMGDDDQSDNPRHTVELTDYYIYKNVVTVEQYAAYSKATGKSMPSAPGFNPKWSKRDHPIVNVSWHEARAYAQWAGGDLPSEAQWERAARGAGRRKFPWGDEFDASKLWCNRSSSEGTGVIGERGMTPEGVSDMAGNVWQWCLDGYDAGFWETDPARVVNPVNNTATMYRVLRGGSWYSYSPDVFRCADRDYGSPSIRNFDFGFRCVFRVNS
ncbi:MAG: SUMF1/EgtB/PvdO family nonheme iron enzyme [Armatimonadetes bacterium]|nr:SUMF1/EgtB/PvdO family nonheme iron enzyme [Armatimonadota bacterium]